MAKVNVYIDGFNLYYGSTRNTPYRWLDLNKLCMNMLLVSLPDPETRNSRCDNKCI